MDETRRRIHVYPGITPVQMQAIWEAARYEASSRPGEEVSIVFAAGTYPLPAPGSLIWKDPPTPLRVRPPGTEIIFTCTPEEGISIRNSPLSGTDIEELRKVSGQ